MAFDSKKTYFISENEDLLYVPSFKLRRKIVLITGAGNAVRKSTAILFAKEGASIALTCFNEDQEAESTKRRIEELDAKCLLLSNQATNEMFCKEAIDKTIAAFGAIDILININEQITSPQSPDYNSHEFLDNIFRSNVYSTIFFIKAAFPFLNEGSSIINTVPAPNYYMDYTSEAFSATKGAIINLTQSLAVRFANKGIRVNAVAPGPIRTQENIESVSNQNITYLGETTLMKRAGFPKEIAPSYLFLASEDSSYITGQIIYPDGGKNVKI